MQKTLLISVLLFVSIIVQAQSEKIKQAWDLFEQDKLTESREAFEAALGTPDEARAHLGISLVDAALGADASFYHYNQFYKTAENAQYYLDALWSFDSGKRTDAELEFLESVAEKYSGTLKAKALQNIGYHYRSSNKIKKSKGYFSEIGAIEEWNLVGDFQNISESGFDKDFGVLDHPDDFEAHLPVILRRANAVGALTTTQRGAIPALPTREQVEAFIMAQSES